MPAAKIIKVPRKSRDLAYICGFIMGDGHLCYRPEKYDRSVTITGNLSDERDFYVRTLAPLLYKLFGVNFKVKIKNHDNSINLICYSKTLLNFLTNVCNIPVGRKSHKIQVPNIFKTTNLFKAFLQGYADADFCLCLKKRHSNKNYYPVISCASRSDIIIKEISKFLNKLGFSVYTELNTLKFDKRLDKSVIMSTVTLYGHNNLVKWMREIGFKNTKYLNRFELWKVQNKNNNRAKAAFELLKI